MKRILHIPSGKLQYDPYYGDFETDLLTFLGKLEWHVFAICFNDDGTFQICLSTYMFAIPVTKEEFELIEIEE